MRAARILWAAALVAACAFGGAAFAQSQAGKPKAAVYIMGNPEGRDALRMAVNNFLIKSGKYQMIAVDAIDVVAKEHIRQMSGSVSDAQIAKLGQDAGAKYVCVVERTELEGVSYVATRMISVESKVAELSEMAVLPKGGTIIDFVQKQIGAMLGTEFGAQTAPVALPPQTAVAAPTTQASPPPAAYTAPVVQAPAATATSGASVFIATLPPKAQVYIDGKYVGTSNEGELQVPVGTRQVKFVKDGVERTKTMIFNPGKNPTWFVNLNELTQTKPKAAPADTLNELASLMNMPLSATQVSTSGEFKYPWYLNAVRSKIESNWRPATENRNIAVVISFEIHRDGSAHAIKVVSSSGVADIDNMGIRAVTISSPFGKLPSDFAGDKVEVYFTLRPTRKY